MRFVVDAQLPARLARFLDAAGHDCVHTTALPDGNHSRDEDIAELADAEDRVVISKDRDFRDGHLLRGTPRRLLIVATGNVSNHDLLALFEKHLGTIAEILAEADLVELGPQQLIVHADRTD
ncbi:DUF5615 family PIN-like protein [Amycolatopsis alkalitolerans]|uniref:DUF5615 domain-containing protein n=1 Tax=Amycolatopsis alkalitolerans TaxID=2547244 RepID=A0A5C4LSH8_9PSEU|nr:DUF5615 family PIN-like protein [Amycolatopsis alkalitolerans]TNC19616.1 hypothetical protein FG385_32145 [Amycolatopsis alkalitolerans]